MNAIYHCEENAVDFKELRRLLTEVEKSGANLNHRNRIIYNDLCRKYIPLTANRDHMSKHPLPAILFQAEEVAEKSAST